MSDTSFNILISAPYLQPDLAAYTDELTARGIAWVVPPVQERLEEADLLELLPDCDGIICGDDRITARVLAAATRLKVIVKWGTGIDSIDVTAACRQGIPVCNTPNAFTEPVSDSVLALMLCFARQILPSDRLMKSGGWEKRLGFCLSEKTLGIVGVGNIGRAVARKAGAFGMRLLGTDIKAVPSEVVQALSLEMVSLKELLQQSDIISLNCDLNPTSHHLINAATLLQMRPEAFLINTARGPVVHEADLIAALQKGIIAGAGLDVFEHEPLPQDSPLRKMPQCILSAHAVNSSRVCWEKVHRSSLDQLYQALGV